MSFFRNDGIQVQEYEYDFAVDGGATGVIDLSAKANKADMPTGCIVKGAFIHVLESLTGSGASAKIGSSASDNIYLASRDVDGAGALGLGADQLAVYSTPLVLDAANKADVIMTIAGGAVTAGRLKVLVEYVHHNG